jgi:hypothetical protein
MKVIDCGPAEATTLMRIQSEYREMPGLRLSAAQAQRFHGLEPSVCQAVLDALVDAGFLRIGRDGCYTRRTDGDSTVAPRRVSPPRRHRLPGSSRTRIHEQRREA